MKNLQPETLESHSQSYYMTVGVTDQCSVSVEGSFVCSCETEVHEVTEEERDPDPQAEEWGRMRTTLMGGWAFSVHTFKKSR